MKITHPVLNNALRGLKLAKPRKTSLPVLDCVCLSANEKTVTLTATDLDQSLTYTGELAEPSPRGARLVPLAVLLRVAREMPKDAVFSLEKPGQIVCAAGNMTTLVPYEAPAPEEFPSPKAVAGKEIELPPAALHALQQARLVASESGSRRNISCVCLEPAGAVATDASQLFHSNTLALPLAGPRLFPAHKLLGFFDPEQPAALRLPAGQKSRNFALRQGPWTWQAAFLDEVYPNWRKVVLPKDEPCTQVCFADDTQSQLRQLIGLIPRDPRHPPTMAFVVRGEKLVAVTCQGAGAQVHELRPRSVAGRDAHTWFNASFLLRALDYGFTSLCWRDAQSVVIARDEHREYLFMPLNVADDKLPEPLRPPPPAAPEQNNPPTHHEPNHNPPEPMTKTTSTTPTPASAPGVATPTAPASGQAQPASKNPADVLLLQWHEARESVRVALGRLDEVRQSLKTVSRKYRDLQKEHEGLKRSLRSLQQVKV